ncbi:twin-arginine translocase TatA/TatE family subunit [Kribbella solani]|uniref:twin-arginine translocase TatA/TatE family subunit n=1 Tax=Kribbella solani TaxID=236067 RepID=UPI0029AEA4EA|nr:twin-arginine translocase TatA/TatE family subunit [Kribbella solani]MDX2970997.1 twin-arginine translocase TatA/TatE family subunit [Kribbella solani]
MVVQLALPEGGEWIVILVIVILLFGAKKLPELTKNAARAMKEFEKARNGDDDEQPAQVTAQSQPMQAAQPQSQPQSQPVQQSVQPQLVQPQSVQQSVQPQSVQPQSVQPQPVQPQAPVQDRPVQSAPPAPPVQSGAEPPEASTPR